MGGDRNRDGLQARWMDRGRPSRGRRRSDDPLHFDPGVLGERQPHPGDGGREVSIVRVVPASAARALGHGFTSTLWSGVELRPATHHQDGN